MYYLSIISWVVVGITAFFFHQFKYPDFPWISHAKLLSGYWILGAGVLAQLEYSIFEKTYKTIATDAHYYVFNEKISYRVIESFFILTIAPALTLLLVLTRYQGENTSSEHMIQELTYLIALFVSVALVCAKIFGDMLKKDTHTILQSIQKIQKGTYIVDIEVHRADELGEISSAIQAMGAEIDQGIGKVNTLNKEIVTTQKEIVYTMGEIAETRSKETGNHVKRVALYSKLLALFYGLSEEEAELLKLASPMHDIGKIAIPDHILNKPGKHTSDEFKVMQTHAQIGYEILKNSNRPILKTAAIVAAQHHEKWNGSGYPNGLSGDNIHIYGRITAVADVFDALGSDRIYKQAWGDESIFALLKEESGKHFDPKLIEIFFNHLNEFLSIRNSLKDCMNHHNSI
ncbi:HD domain-containing protein [Sulfurospirillum diekertiae]|uniref:HD domain-containing protein n=1 Tax=Sulfurospirillum diekertiae TaxID=1854492 RepID=A0AA92FKL1_9BACT|nr:HD domain-containing protein [Sulfurospirillum diekertiae]